jgi:hypothetical protein
MLSARRTSPRKVLDGALRCTDAMPAVRPDLEAQPGLRFQVGREVAARAPRQHL